MQDTVFFTDLEERVQGFFQMKHIVGRRKLGADTGLTLEGKGDSRVNRSVLPIRKA
jgi:hypothetical protein